jgi:hypothetical protein
VSTSQSSNSSPTNLPRVEEGKNGVASGLRAGGCGCSIEGGWVSKEAPVVGSWVVVAGRGGVGWECSISHHGHRVKLLVRD